MRPAPMVALFLILALAAWPAAAAQPPSMDGIEAVPGTSEAASDDEAVGGRFLRVCLEDRDGYRAHHPMTRGEYRSLSTAFRSAADTLLSDEAIVTVAERVARASGRVVPIDCALSATSRTSHFDHVRIVLGPDTVDPDRGQAPTTSARTRKLRERAFRNTVIHELGHALQHRLYGGWLPEIDYRSTEFANTDSGGHWFDKETVPASAWCEGFAEGLAAFLGEDERIGVFSGRRLVYYGIREPRPSSRLERIEGHVAFQLHDFWLPRGTTAHLDRTLDVLRLSSPAATRTERHGTFHAYVFEHLSRYPEDALRWELVGRANSLLRDGLIAGPSLPAEVAAQADALRKGLASLGAKVGVDRAAQAIQAWLASGGEATGPVAVILSGIEAMARRLAGTDAPVFVVPGSGGEDYETMPLAELEKIVDNARRDFDNWFQTYGYDFHPRCKEAKERWKKLEAILVRRRGR